MRWRAQTATTENGFVHLPEAAIGAPKSAPFESDKAAKQTKCSIYVMAGLVPAIHVAGLPVLQYIVTTSSEPWQNTSKYFTFFKLDHVDGRDKPGHDGAI